MQFSIDKFIRGKDPTSTSRLHHIILPVMQLYTSIIYQGRCMSISSKSITLILCFCFRARDGFEFEMSDNN